MARLGASTIQGETIPLRSVTGRTARLVGRRRAGDDEFCAGALRPSSPVHAELLGLDEAEEGVEHVGVLALVELGPGLDNIEGVEDGDLADLRREPGGIGGVVPGSFSSIGEER